MNDKNKKIGSSLLAGSILLSNMPVQTFALETEGINNEAITTNIEIKDSNVNITDDNVSDKDNTIIEDSASENTIPKVDEYEDNQVILDHIINENKDIESEEIIEPSVKEPELEADEIINTEVSEDVKEDSSNSFSENENIDTQSYANVEDEGLLRFFNTTLNKDNLTAPVTIAEIATIKGIVDLTSYNVKSLEGLQYATGITDLHLDNCEVSDLTPLSSLTNLKTLYASNNKITDLTPISNLKNLFWIEVNHNNITDISVLSGLPKLYVIHASNNKITNANLHSLPELEYLDLDFNQLTSLNFNSLPMLYLLKANNNKINTLDLHSLPSLQSLYLDNNQLTNLDLNSFPRLIEVYANNNNLTELNLDSLHHLNTIGVFGNNITHVNLSSLSAINYLDLSNNNITELNLTSLPSLAFLDLCDNKLTDVSMLSQIQSLEILCIEGNNITDISFINNMPNLINFYAANNNIEEAVIENANSLMYLDLDNNKLSKLTIENAPMLESLFAGYNNLSDVNLNIDDVPNLNYISFYGNNFSELPDFVSKRKFSFLSFGKNNISDVSKIYDAEYVCIEDNHVKDVSHIGTLPSLNGACLGKQTVQMTDLNLNTSNVSIELPAIKDIYGNEPTIKEISNNGYFEDGHIKWDNLEEGSYNLSIKFEGPTIIGDQYDDNYYSDLELVINQRVNIDLTGPEISITPSITDWTKDNVTLDISSTDKYSKVEKIVLPDGTEIIGDSAKFEVSNNGLYEFKAVDSLGNISIKTIEITNIDKDIPVAKAELSTNTQTNGEVEITFDMFDLTSEIKAIYFINDKGERVEVGDVFKASENGTYSFEVEDVAGNINLVSITVDNIDKVAPILTLNQTLTEKGEVLIEVTASDAESGIDVIILPDGTEVKGNSASFVVNESGEYIFKVIDKVGHITEKSIYINLESEGTTDNNPTDEDKEDSNKDNNNNNENSDSSDNKENPKTGDEGIAYYLGLLISSLLSLFILSKQKSDKF